MNKTLSAAELRLLSGLADGRLIFSEIDPVLILELERAGLVRRLQGHWRLSASGALACMSEPAH